MGAREGRPKSPFWAKGRAYRPFVKDPGPFTKRVHDYQSLGPAFKYFGGKSKLAKRIVRQLPEHTTFVEPFAGGASVTLAKPPSEKEVLNDKRADVINFYRHVKSGKKIHLVRPSRHRFYQVRDKPETQRTPGEFLLLQSKSFGGHGQSYADGSGSKGEKLMKNYDRYWRRLQKTTLLNTDYKQAIDRYDSPSTLFYLDPPYPETIQDYTNYGHMIPSVETIRQTVDGIKGRVMLSYPDTPEVRRAFPESKFHVKRFRLYKPLTSFNPGPRTRSELLILNYTPSARNHWHLLERVAG
jgi:DNA adenine methylase